MWRMSVTSSAGQRTKANGVDAYDSGDDWEIGLGNLIIDLEADLEKDRRKSEMNRILTVKSPAEELPFGVAAESTSAAYDGLASPAANFCTEVRRFKEKRRNSCASDGGDKLRSFDPPPRAVPKVCITKRREAQGRPGEAFAMNSSDANASCAKGKEGKRGKHQSKGLRKEKDCVRTRKEKHGEGFELENGRSFGRTEESSRYCAHGGTAVMERDEMDAKGIRASAFVVEEDGGSCEREHNHKTLSIKTRSVGTNTQEAERAVESNYMEPCQPGTSVNLEGIVWHETEEGVLVVNVTWRKRTYVGTLLDCTKHDWAPPRFCESPISDSEMTCGRGRGKRMRLAVSDQSVTEPGLSKIRGLTHKRRGVGIGNKGRRGSLNFSTCRTPTYFSVEDIKSSSLMCGKRISKAPPDLDLTLLSEDIRNGNGKRIRTKSRSAPSTPQGKSDPLFLEQVCASPILIDCPHPNCNKKYKHINGLRYHQSHAHLDSNSKQEFEAESEDRLSDYDEPLSSMPLDSSENLDIISKKPRTMYKLNSGGSLKNRKLLLSTDHSPPANSKQRRNVIGKEGPTDDLNNLPLISNMSVVLENCLITDRNSSIEMPKLEAEGVIDKREVKKENGVAERCSAKTRTNRFIVTTPAPPKLIAIPTFPNKITDGSSHQPSPSVAITKTKNLSLKPIKPKLDIVAQVNMSNAAIVVSKENKRKEKHRLKDRNYKDSRSPKTDPAFIKADDIKSIGKDLPVSLLKEHLSKQDVVNGLSETQESRMASIRAEADKVYTFTDNAPSPSIGSSARMDSGTLSNCDSSTTKTNSPAYSDISDVAEDGGLNSRSRRNSAPDSNLNGNINPKIQISSVTTAMGKETQASTHGHAYESYGLPGYMHSGQGNSAAYLKVSTPYSRTKEDVRELSEDLKTSETIADSSSQSQLQLAMTQTQTALAQSLYYGQYTRNAPIDQKVLIVPNNHRQQNEACCDDVQCSKQSRVQARRGPEQKERAKEDTKQIITSSVAIHKGTNSVKISCAKPGFIYVELDKQLPLQQPQVKSSIMSITKDQGLNKESEDFNSECQNAKTIVDTNVTYLNASESQSWNHSFQSKYVKHQNQEVNKVSQEIGPDKGKDWHVPPEPQPRLEAELQNVHCETTSEDIEENTRAEVEKTPSETSENPQSTRVAVSSSQQSYIQYQHSYPYLHLCETNNTSFSVMSPALVHNYPGYHYPLYGKTPEREESSGMQHSKSVSDPTDLELLPPHSHPYHGKCPVPGDPGGTEQEDRDTERERESFAHHLHTHHHTHLGMSYSLVSGQYDQFQGLSTVAMCASQQVATTQTTSCGMHGLIA
ncbi:zinc finger protein 608 [Tachysurus fulvidraco]|uniref:zinc finger protein 608 n=1 Tax=Tachysurus fulvidraco TaxID=1234273 RepID=UPI000F4D4B30|nr:zinc finger protein 608 [Tachysurus fulvidraco]